MTSMVKASIYDPHKMTTSSPIRDHETINDFTQLRQSLRATNLAQSNGQLSKLAKIAEQSEMSIEHTILKKYGFDTPQNSQSGNTFATTMDMRNPKPTMLLVNEGMAPKASTLALSPLKWRQRDAQIQKIQTPSIYDKLFQDLALGEPTSSNLDSINYARSQSCLIRDTNLDKLNIKDTPLPSISHRYEAFRRLEPNARKQAQAQLLMSIQSLTRVDSQPIDAFGYPNDIVSDTKTSKQANFDTLAACQRDVQESYLKKLKKNFSNDPLLTKMSRDVQYGRAMPNYCCGGMSTRP